MEGGSGLVGGNACPEDASHENKSIAEGKMWRFGQNGHEEEYDADRGPVSDVATIYGSLIAFLGNNQMNHYDNPSGSFNQSHPDSAVPYNRLGSISPHILEDPPMTHPEPPHPHPISNTVPNEPLQEDAGVQPMLALPPWPRRESSSISLSHLRPLGPRGPLLSYSQLYGEFGEGDTNSEWHVDASQSSWGEVEMVDHRRRRAEVEGPSHSQDGDTESDTGQEESYGENIDSVEAESIDRCSEMTPPPPYEERG